MRSERHSSDEQNLVLRLASDSRFVLAYLNQALGKGEGGDVVKAFAHLALALDGVAIPAQAIDPDEARVVLERIQGLLQFEAQEIILDMV